MVTLEQIRLLEERVKRAVDYIIELRNENTLLKTNVEKCRKRIDDLEVMITEYKEDRSAIDEGIINALANLDKLEDFNAKTPAAAPAPVSPPEEIEDIEGEELDSGLEVDAPPPPAAAKAKDESKKGELDIF